MKTDVKLVEKSNKVLEEKSLNNAVKNTKLESEQVKYFKDILDSLSTRGINK